MLNYLFNAEKVKKDFHYLKKIATRPYDDQDLSYL